MMDVINERNETIQRQIDAMWGTKCHKLVGCLNQLTRCHTISAQTWKSCIL
jgi:hypothetical protein